ncbi:unnamed protein product [Tuber melanosporum]|uniref:(Perigord truffle) hypothetical protein n=1 Tax=Tuber melanosporum (strain Mel28) TaxID=656061 RepID=D5G9R7_TUBMM|nr:uncharacterized protein GSTUM_00005041001 [Tuber melanosporum]CAZ81260.1 unnamed protein product [Tuber melanosporum]
MFWLGPGILLLVNYSISVLHSTKVSPRARYDARVLVPLLCDCSVGIGDLGVTPCSIVLVPREMSWYETGIISRVSPTNCPVTFGIRTLCALVVLHHWEEWKEEERSSVLNYYYYY